MLHLVEMQNFVAKLTDFYTTLQEECGSRIRDNDTVYYAPLVPYDELEIPGVFPRRKRGW